MLSELQHLPPSPFRGRKSPKNHFYESELNSRNGTYNVNRPVELGFQVHEQTASENVDCDKSISEKSINPTRRRLSATNSCHTNSKSNQIKELSGQLQARLSYAMFKMQNGWQSHTLADLEGKSSAQVSPVFALSDQRPPVTPRKAYTNKGRRTLPSSINRLCDKGTTVPISRSLPSGYPNKAPGLGATQKQPKCLTSHASRGVVNGAHESYNKQKYQSASERRVQSRPSINHTPSLAPPANIWPRNSQHSQLSHEEPRFLDTDQDYRPRSSRRVFSTSASASPSSQQAYPTRSPSQKAADEKDAVETLVLMSSPSNPGTQRSSKMPLEILPKTPVANPIYLSVGLEAGHRHKTHRERKIINPTRLPRSSDIDRVLDEMTDESSSDDESFGEQWDT
ncbi:MAG: hypothetical protein LQ351_007459 [Letrouitia transgressa]|nr:MAG: hypothetical protein LQ351_007459 [Letrouitia transgressa]